MPLKKSPKQYSKIGTAVNNIPGKVDSKGNYFIIDEEGGDFIHVSSEEYFKMITSRLWTHEEKREIIKKQKIINDQKSGDVSEKTPAGKINKGIGKGMEKNVLKMHNALRVKKIKTQMLLQLETAADKIATELLTPQDKETYKEKYPFSKPKFSSGWNEEKLDTQDVEFKKEVPFKLGKYEVATKDKVELNKFYEKEYVSQIEGSVDETSYNKNKIYSEKLYRDAIKASEEITTLYEKNKNIFTPNAIKIIENIYPQLKLLADGKPTSHKKFKKLIKGIDKEKIYGPDGVLNIILAFNRVKNSLKEGALKTLSNPESNTHVMINLNTQKTRTSSVEIAYYEPEIKQPKIDLIKKDFSADTIKRQNKDGTYTVLIASDSYNKSEGTVGDFILDINPKTKIISITKSNFGWRKKFNSFNEMTFQEFNEKVEFNPYFLETTLPYYQ